MNTDSEADRFFNPWRVPRTGPAKRLVETIITSVETYEQIKGLRQRKRKPDVQKTFEATITAVICDLMHYALTKNERPLVIPRSNRVLGKRERNKALAFNQQLPKLVDTLGTDEVGWLIQEKGERREFTHNQRTTIRPSPRLIQLMEKRGINLADIGRTRGEEVIILKAGKKDYWDKGRRISFDDTPTTHHLREQMLTINAWLADARIEFDETVLVKDRIIDTNQRHLRRCFTRGSFESGGRLYGGFWIDLGKQERLDGLTINGEEIVSLDYGQIGPRILYSLAGEQPPAHDLYDIPGLTGLHYGVYRDGIKKVMNALSFSERLSRKPKNSKHLLPRHLTIDQIVSLIKQAHPAIAHLLGTEIGHKVQFIESEIMVEVILELKAKGIVALPVHDCVLVPKSARAKAESVMLEVFKDKTGVKVIVSEEIGYSLSTLDVGGLMSVNVPDVNDYGVHAHL
jgi:hypothetical protein